MSVTLQNLIDDCEADLGDSGNAVWAAADVEQWCRDAIADYSQHFQVTEVSTINCTDGDRQYDLPVRFVDALEVEYPEGEDPPQFLQRRPHTHPEFWHDEGYYDILYNNSDSDADELLISSKPATGEDIKLHWTGTYDNSMLTSAAIHVPVEHHHILRGYVIWRATLQLKAVEEASPTSNSSLLMSQLAINVDRARRAYVDSLAKALYATAKSAVVSWKDQDQATGRIY
ncbi:MAG: hypothetical protein PVH18_04550 [Chloroflexota bacterium]|jgi:hypothetical protein